MTARLHVLIVRFGSLGDVILTTPLVRAIRRRHRDAAITFVTKRQYAPIIEHHPDVAEARRLFHQAIDRQSISDAVYVAVPKTPGRAFVLSMRKNIKLCRRMGLGLMTVRLKDGHVDVPLDPAPYQPRKNKRRRARLLREFARLTGDPNTGGSTRRGLVTAYRQDALRCLDLLQRNGPTKAALVAGETGVSTARRIMSDNHYGWFERVETGIYALSQNGEKALSDYADEIARISQSVELSA